MKAKVVLPKLLQAAAQNPLFARTGPALKTVTQAYPGLKPAPAKGKP